jgi:hypothetical protein
LVLDLHFASGMDANRRERNEIWKAMGIGLLAGLAGTVVMTLSEKLEQRLTGRPDSYVPAHTAERLLGLPEQPGGRRKHRPGNISPEGEGPWVRPLEARRTWI